MKDIKKEAEKAKKAAETAKKLDVAKSELKSKKEFLERDIEHGRDTGRNAIEVKYAAQKVERLKKELDKLH